jgi:hypothetical protein
VPQITGLGSKRVIHRLRFDAGRTPIRVWGRMRRCSRKKCSVVTCGRISPGTPIVSCSRAMRRRLKLPRYIAILARRAVAPMTSGLPSATDAPLQRSELPFADGSMVTLRGQYSDSRGTS